MEVEIAENTCVRVLRSKILTVEVKGEPVSEQNSKPAIKAGKGKNKKKQSDNSGKSGNDEVAQIAAPDEATSENDITKVEKDGNKAEAEAAKEKTGA